MRFVLLSWLLCVGSANAGPTLDSGIVKARDCILSEVVVNGDVLSITFKGTWNDVSPFASIDHHGFNVLKPHHPDVVFSLGCVRNEPISFDLNSCEFQEMHAWISLCERAKSLVNHRVDISLDEEMVDTSNGHLTYPRASRVSIRPVQE